MKFIHRRGKKNDVKQAGFSGEKRPCFSLTDVCVPTCELRWKWVEVHGKVCACITFLHPASDFSDN